MGASASGLPSSEILISLIIKKVFEFALGPLVSLGGKYLDNQKDKERLQHGTDRVVYEADAAVRSIKLKSIFGILPLFAAECAASIYFISIMVDSTFPMEWLTPLELPDWFKPHFYVAMASIFGIATVDRWLRK